MSGASIVVEVFLGLLYTLITRFVDSIGARLRPSMPSVTMLTLS